MKWYKTDHLRRSSPALQTMDSPARQNWTGTGYNRIAAPLCGDAITMIHEGLGGKILAR